MRPSRSDRVVLWVILVGALAYSAGTIVVGGTQSMQTFFAAGETPVALLTSVEVPTTEGDATIVSGTFTDTSLTVSGLSDFARGMLGTGVVLGTLTALAVSLSVAFFCGSLLRRRPFRRSLTITALVAGIALLFGGLLGQAATGFGTMQAAFDLDPSGAIFDPGFWFDTTPLLGGFAIMALGIAFQLGERLQHDTEGLV